MSKVRFKVVDLGVITVIQIFLNGIFEVLTYLYLSSVVLSQNEIFIVVKKVVKEMVNVIVFYV